MLLFFPAALLMARRSAVDARGAALCAIFCAPIAFAFSRLSYAAFARYGLPLTVAALGSGGTIPGALAGLATGAFIYARLFRVSAGALLDVLAPPAAIFIAVAQLSWLCPWKGFPSVLPLCEALAMIPVAVVLFVRGPSVRTGDGMIACVFAYCAARVITEPFYEVSAYIGFVRVAQVSAAAYLLILTAYLLVRALLAGAKPLRSAVHAGASLCALVVAFLAMFYEGSASEMAMCVTLCACMAVMAACAFGLARADKEAQRA